MRNTIRQWLWRRYCDIYWRLRGVKPTRGQSVAVHIAEAVMARSCGKFVAWEDVYDRDPLGPMEWGIKRRRLCVTCGFCKEHHKK